MLRIWTERFKQLKRRNPLGALMVVMGGSSFIIGGVIVLLFLLGPVR